MKRFFLFLVICLLMVFTNACSNRTLGENPGEPDSARVDNPEKKCGDGVCDGPETTDTCPVDCQSTGPSADSTTQVPLPAGNQLADAPPLYFFYAVHVHGSKEYLPYSGPGLTAVDPTAAENILAAIEGIAAVLDKHGAKATWEFMAPTVLGLLEYQDGPVIFDQLVASGHEIGVHGHRLDAVPDAVRALVDSAGVTPVTSSGFLTQIPTAGEAQAQNAMSLVMRETVKNGLSVGTVNFNPGGEKNTVSGACNDRLGIGNDMYGQTGNLLFPWKPDYPNEDICSDLTGGDLILIDHVPLTAFILPGQDAPPDVLAAEHFNQLAEYFDNAVAYMADNQPDRTASWGFVTHIIEYAVGGQAENPPEPSALTALDDFLSHVDTCEEQGLVIYATASEIADQVP